MGPPPRTRDCVKVDIVRHAAIGAVVEHELHHVALANANESPRDCSSERPERLFHSVREALHELLGLGVSRLTIRRVG